MKLIATNNSKYFIVVDDVDAALVACRSWTVSFKDGKVDGCRSKFKGKQFSIGRYILNYEGPLEVDHKDRDPLNNQRENLRIVTHQQNSLNRERARGLSQYKGVCWHKGSNRWMAQFGFKGKKYFVGYFTSEVEAALAYNIEVKKIQGEFAYLNKV